MNLKLRWFLTFALLAVVLTAVVSFVLTQVASTEIRKQAGSSLADAAYQMSDKLERGMFERYRDIQVAAALIARFQLRSEEAELQSLINRLQTTYSDYAWIGLTAADGEVLVSTGGVLQGQNVAARPWFQNAISDTAYVGDVHEALLLERELNQGRSEPLRFVDVAIPIRNNAGDITGVLGAHLNWRWGRELERSVLDTSRLGETAELILVGSEDRVVLGPAGLEEREINSRALDELRDNNFGYQVETWDDGITYVVGYAQSGSYRDYEGLNWRVIVRQPIDDAFAPVYKFEQQVLFVSLAVVVLFAMIGWLSAERISRPLIRITEAARKLGEDPDVQSIPMLRDYPEVNDLSAALNILIQRVDDKQRQLSQLNQDLDQMVKDRTAELSKANKELKFEVSERRKAQKEREKLIKQLEQQAYTDALTELANRRYFFEHGEKLLKRAQRQSHPVAMLMFDLDYFKQLNDTYGHAAGDDVLVGIGQLIKATARDTDIAARTGGEEFAVLLDDTDLEGAKELAERLRATLRDYDFASVANEREVTLSLGIAVWDREESLEQLLNRADKAMYQAKEKGRNRVEAAPVK